MMGDRILLKDLRGGQMLFIETLEPTKAEKHIFKQYKANNLVVICIVAHREDLDVSGWLQEVSFVLASVLSLDFKKFKIYSNHGYGLFLFYDGCLSGFDKNRLRNYINDHFFTS